MFICVGMLRVYHPLLPLWQDFADELDAMPKITMVNNMIHNNQGYGVILVKPGDATVEDLPAEHNAAGALFFFCCFSSSSAGHILKLTPASSLRPLFLKYLATPEEVETLVETDKLLQAL